MANPLRDLGPCVVVWDPDSDNVIFNKSHGGVKFRYEEARAGVKEDQAGETDVDEITTGVSRCELEVPITRDELADLDKVFANSSQAGTYLKVSNPVGAACFADAKHIIVKPIVNGTVSVTNTEWLHIWRAFPRVNMEMAYDNSGQRVFNVIFKGFPDDESTRVGEMWKAGN